MVKEEEEPEQNRNETEVNKKRGDAEKAMAKSISKVDIMDLPESPRYENYMGIHTKPLTAGLPTSRNKMQSNYLSTETIDNAKMKTMNRGRIPN
jgi:hypothetical protein